MTTDSLSIFPQTTRKEMITDPGDDDRPTQDMTTDHESGNDHRPRR